MTDGDRPVRACAQRSFAGSDESTGTKVSIGRSGSSPHDRASAMLNEGPRPCLGSWRWGQALGCEVTLSMGR